MGGGYTQAKCAYEDMAAHELSKPFNGLLIK